MRHQIGFFIATTALYLSLTSIPATAQVTFQAFVEGAFITDMSADGSVAVGYYDSGSTTTVFRWTSAGGLQLIGADNMFNQVYISRDGRVIVGTAKDAQGNYHAAVWTSGKTWQLLTPFAGAVPSEGHNVSIAHGVSGDGSVIVGSAYVSLTKAVAFRWDPANGMVNLGTFDEGTNSDSVAYGVSADGRMVYGWDYKEGFSPAGPGGSAMNGRRGAIWWDGKERLLHPFGWAGEAWATNAVGSIITGQFHPLDANNDPTIGHGASTYLWTAWDGHFEDLGAVSIPIGGDQRNYLSQPYAMSDDGSVVGGETGWSDKFGMIWTPATGMMYMSDYLTKMEVTDHLQWARLNKVVYISPDGRRLVGYGLSNPQPRTYIVTLK